MKDLCEGFETLLENQEGYENFKRLICGDSAGESADDEFSVEAMCYLFNYERFTQGGVGPDYEASEWPTIFPPKSVEIDDSCHEIHCEDFCTLTVDGEDEGMRIPCDCYDPEEFVSSKDMLNKGMFFILKSSE